MGGRQDVSGLIATAWQAHQSGRFADAARCYHTLLENEPGNADAVHLYGVLHHQHRYFERAVELIGRAVALRPDSAAFQSNLAESYRELGQPQQAIECCEAALKLQPDHPEAMNNLGLALHDLGRFEMAVTQFRAALKLRPDFALAQNNLGDSLRELNATDAAIQAFRAAIEIDPGLSIARSNLGQMLLDQGEANEALEHCLEAVRLDPGLAASHNNLGNVYRSLERWNEAHAAYDVAQRLAPELPRVYSNRGLALQLQGKQVIAFDYFRRATELAPLDVAMWRYLADAYVAEEEYAAALPCWERIVALEPDQAQGHAELGWFLQEEGRLADAAGCYRRALELRPRYLQAILYQGGLHEELGELTQAEACYRQAQSLYPWAPGPLSRLATLLRARLPDPDRDTIQERLQNLRPNAPWRGPMLFGLAQVLDGRGEYVEAARCLAEANALDLKQKRKVGHLYDPAAHERFVDRLIENFNPDLFQRLSGAGADSRTPVFVVGMPRSGTTLVEQILASHSQVFGAGELRLVRQAFEGIPGAAGRNDHNIFDGLKALDAAGIGRLVEQHRLGLKAILDKSGWRPKDSERGDLPDRIVDKMPDNYLNLGLMALLYPQATFIHVKRDPRDVAVSSWMTGFASIRWASDPEHLASRFQQHRRIMAHWRDVLPVPIHEVVYERLVDDFETEARRLLAACGLEWEPACLNFHQTSRPVRTASITQVRQPLYRKSLARWKNYEVPLAELFSLLPQTDTDAVQLNDRV